jgi:hypothetical protein
VPVPDAPELTITHNAFEAAVHAHPFAAVTFTDPLPPPAPTFCEVAESEKEQLTASCCTVNVCPAMVSVPVRAAPVLAAALNVIEPFPLPDVALVMVSQFALLAAVHAQPLAAVTVTVPVPPPAGTLWLGGAIE